MKKIVTFVSVVVALLAVSCQKTTVEDAITLSSPTTATISQEGDVVTINFNASVAWTAKSSQSWLTVSPASGEAGNATLKASALKNDNTDERSAEVTITAGTKSAKVTVTQGQLNALEVKEADFEVPAEGGTVEIPISANVNYEVVIPEAVDWITVTSTKGMVDSKVVLEVAPSYEEATDEAPNRTATISIKAGDISQTIKIVQDPFIPYYDMELPEGVGMFSGFGDGNPLVLEADATSFTIPVSTNLEHYCYFAPWDAETGGPVETNDVGWIKFEYDNEKIVFTIEPNTGYVPREEYFYSGCFVGDIDFGAFGSCILIHQEGQIPEAGANVLWTRTLPEIGVAAGYNRLAYKTANGDALLLSDGEKVNVLDPATGNFWKSITWAGVKPTSICSDESGNVIVGEDITFTNGTTYSVYYTSDVNEEPVKLFDHTADFDGTIGSWRVRGDLSDRAVVTGFISGSRYWAGWEIDKFQVSLDNYYNVNGQARGPIAVDGDAWNPESGAVMSLASTLKDGIVYRAYDTNWKLHFLKDAYTPAWITPYDWKEISDAGAGAGNENQNNMDIIEYNGRRIMAYTQGAWFTWGGNHDVYFLDVTNPESAEVIAILNGDELAAVEEIKGEDGMATNPYADVKLHVEEDLGLVCYVVNSTYESLSKILIVF